MKCYICAGQNVDNDARGLCTDCLQGVCGQPPKRRDKEYHGAVCLCGCGHLVCEIHFPRHAEKFHGSIPPRCFPKRTLANAAVALQSSLDVKEGGDSAAAPFRLTNDFLEHTGRMNHFLNAIAVGPDVMEQWGQAFAPRGVQETHIGETTEFWFTPEWFRGDTCTRLAAVAARMIATVAVYHDLAWLRVILSTEAYKSLGALIAHHAPALVQQWPRRPLFDFRLKSLLDETLPPPAVIVELPRLPGDLVGGVGVLRWLMQTHGETTSGPAAYA